MSKGLVSFSHTVNIFTFLTAAPLLSEASDNSLLNVPPLIYHRLRAASTIQRMPNALRRVGRTSIGAIS